MERQGFLIKSNSLQKMGRLEVRANWLDTNLFRKTCCIQDALTEISKVVQDDPSSSKAILIKAEIFYEMGLFEQVGCDWSAGHNTRL